LRKGRIKEAKGLCHKDDPDLAYVLGLCMLEEGLKEEALELLMQVASSDPTLLGVRRRVVELALELGMEDVAAQTYAFINAHAFWEKEELMDAVAEVEEVVEEAETPEEDLLVLDEDDFLTVEMVETYVQQCLFEEALEQVEKLLEKEPDNQRALELKERIERYLSLLEPEEPS